MIIEIAGKQWQVRVASDHKAITTGLSNLPYMTAWTGMYFYLGRVMIARVTTHEMMFPLDVAFISSRKVVDIARNVKPGNLISSAAYCDSFLEVNAGEMDNVNVGDEVVIYFAQFDPMPQPEPRDASIYGQMAELMVVGMVGIMGMDMVKTMTRPKDALAPTTRALMIPPTRDIVIRGQVLKVITVPGGARWKCEQCHRDLVAGEQAVKLGRMIFCSACVREGYYADTITSVEKAGFMFQTELDDAFTEAIRRVQGS